MSADISIALVDKCGSLYDAARRSGWTNVDLMSYTDISEVPLDPGTAFVSPANSIGFMDGGVDYAYSRVMFPGLEPRVKRAIANSHEKKVSNLLRPYLPIGTAIVLPARDDNDADVSMVIAPTMFHPQIVIGTQNAYHATYAALKAAAAFNIASHKQIKRLVFPGMCTGCGQMPADEAIGQMRRAQEDWLAGKNADSVSLDEIASQQPRVYANTEFFDTENMRLWDIAT